MDESTPLTMKPAQLIEPHLFPESRPGCTCFTCDSGVGM